MRKFLVSATAAGFALALPLGVAFAQDAAPKPEDSIQQRVVPQNNEITFEEIEMADSNFKVALEQMGSLKDDTAALNGASLSKVEIVPVEEIVDPAKADGQSIAAMQTTHKADLEALHTALSGNAGLKSLLDAHDVKIENVLAVKVGEDGVVTLYVQKIT